MSATQILESTVQRGHLAAARELAVALYADAERLLEGGYDPRQLHDELSALYQKYREAGDVISRDALVEVLDELDDRFAA